MNKNASSSSPCKQEFRKQNDNAIKNSIAEILAQFPQTLTTSTTSLLDCETLLAFILKTSRTYLYTWPEQTLTIQEYQKFLRVFERRQQGEPIAYIVGHKEFWSLDLMVNSHVLIPRPETELLVETALKLLPQNQTVEVADLGTGSGAIALAIAKERPQAHIKATDYSKEALRVAQQNAEQLEIKNVQFVHGYWCDAIEGPFDLIVSNPPYVTEQDPHLSIGDVQFEPKEALVAEENGLGSIRYLINACRKHLKKNGYLLLEHGYSQADEVQNLFKKQGYTEIQTLQDLEANNRVTFGKNLNCPQKSFLI